MTIKDRFGLPTDRGLTYVGFFFGVLQMADTIEGEWKHYLTAAAVVGFIVSAYLTRGSGISPTEGERIKEASPAEELAKTQAPYSTPIQDLLDEGMDTTPIRRKRK